LQRILIKIPLSIPLVKNTNANLRSNPFSGYKPRPNWNVTFNGLTRIKGMEKIFTNFTLRHGYNSTLGMNSFTTSLLFQDFYPGAGIPWFIDPATGNYVPIFYFLILQSLNNSIR
jgi:cell surface protein SprA